eukprot:CAMPEP_0115843324 /NCGR_PEP_ID=MMETSP0287-20121206/8253_1 /TAXON_ID=412157 /ORGANISM="Chrysochromulina rotalis, Strain UIO044" /LENGTH=474 /DNA_ID=CAMNT_0003297013 /DNA_START=163 /DNA_END=1587 /DNA_ORIENTATION=-
MAMAYERMGSGFYAYFYADNKAGTTLLAFDPSGEGFCAFADGKPRLTSRKQGGTFCDESGAITRLWNTQKPLDLNRMISFDLSPHIHITFGSRQLITAKLTCQGMTEEFQLGEVQKMATDSYLSKSLGMIKMGPERGKHVLDVDKCRIAAQENRERRAAMGVMTEPPVAKTHVTEDDMKKHPDLRAIVASTSQLQESVKSGAWDVDCFISKEKLANTLGDSFPTLRLGDSIKTDPHSRTFASLPASNPDVLEALLKEHADQPSGPLPLTHAIKAASGRYRPEHGVHYKTPRKPLIELDSRTFDTYIKEEAPKTSVVVVACLAGWLPAAKRAEANLQMLNGVLTAKAGDSTQTWSQMQGEGGGKASASGAAAAPVPEMILRKFDMSQSRFMHKRYNINTLPMYLMFVGGRLAYASSTLNGYGSSVDDLKAQVREVADKAGRGHFLPDDFKFGLTDNALSGDFAATLKGTAPTLGK